MSVHAGAISHVENIEFFKWALWSMNERLGGKEGIDLPEPTMGYMEDVLSLLGSKTPNLLNYQFFTPNTQTE